MSDDSGFGGKCLCGAVTFEASPPVVFCAHCHCDYCRQAHGAALVTWIAVQEDQFRIADGEDLITWYASSKQGRRGFCSRCGSTMFYQSSLCPGEVHITLANVEGRIDHKPSAHVFFDAHVDWLSFDDDLLRLDTDSELLAQFRAVGR